LRARQFFNQGLRNLKSPGAVDRYSTVVWVDLTKFGRVQQNVLASLVDVTHSILRNNPQRSCAFVLAPVLTSTRVLRGMRGECRTALASFSNQSGCK
jgi:hypothetical protein